jgi:hypothetical protein
MRNRLPVPANEAIEPYSMGSSLSIVRLEQEAKHHLLMGQRFAPASRSVIL